MKTYDLTKFGKKDLLILMNNYLKSALNNGEVCRDETMDFLRVYLEYILRLNNRTSEGVVCVFHEATDMNDGEVAYMTCDNKNNCDVYLAKNLFKNKYLPKPTEMEDISNEERRNRNHQFQSFVNKLAYLMTDAGHEIQHVIQYLNNGDSSADMDRKIEKLEHVCEENKTFENRKKLKRIMYKHSRCIGALHKSEIQANKKANEYANDVLYSLLRLNGDAETLNTILSVIDIIKFEDKDINDLYKARTKELQQINTYLAQFEASALI